MTAWFRKSWRRFHWRQIQASNGQTCLYRILRGKHGITGIWLGIDVPDIARFTLRREAAFDRMAKWLGLAREWQTADEEFDSRIYILSEDSRLHDALSLDARLRVAVTDLLKVDRASRIEMDQGVLWLQCGYSHKALGDGPDETIALNLAVAVQPLLSALRERLLQVREPWHESRDKGLERHRWLTGASLLLGVLGFLSLFFKPGPGFPFALMRAQIHAQATQAAVAAFAVLAVVVLVSLGRASRTHRVLASMLFVTTPGVWCGAAVILERYNNTGPSNAEFRTEIAELRNERNGKKRRAYRVRFTTMPEGLAPRLIRIDLETYQSLRTGGCAMLDVRKGALGDPWIAGIRTVSCEDGS